MKLVQKNEHDKKQFPHMLTDYMPLNNLNAHLSLFRKHKEEHNAVVVHSKEGYAIFTTGKLLIKEG